MSSSRRTPRADRPALALRLDISWLPAAVLIIWWLGSRALPTSLPELAAPIYWLLAVGLTVGLLVSIVLHDMAHAAVSLRYGVGMTPKVLYPFGGVPQRDAGAGGPEAEFVSAVAGPATSLVAAFCLLVAADSVPEGSVPAVVLGYLAAMNGIVGALNLVPAFPLDAGRALRAVLWMLNGDFGWATTVSARLGSALGIGLAVIGIFMILSDGSPFGGLIILLLGFTLRSAATTSYRHLLTRRSLGGVAVRQLMDENPITVQRALSVSSLVEDFIYKHHLKMLPVVDGERLLGYVTAQRVKQVPRAEWSRQSIGTIAVPFSQADTVGPETAASEALDKMTSSGMSRLMVVDQGRLAGTIALQDLLRSLQGGGRAQSDVS